MSNTSKTPFSVAEVPFIKVESLAFSNIILAKGTISLSVFTTLP